METRVTVVCIVPAVARMSPGMREYKCEWSDVRKPQTGRSVYVRVCACVWYRLFSTITVVNNSKNSGKRSKVFLCKSEKKRPAEVRRTFPSFL